jgi:copper chaperone CopZ
MGGELVMASVTLNVPDISCEHCERTITNALTPVEGVRRVAVDIPAHNVQVEYDEGRIDVERLKAILEEEDYLVAGVKEP